MACLSPFGGGSFGAKKFVRTCIVGLSGLIVLLQHAAQAPPFWKGIKRGECNFGKFVGSSDRNFWRSTLGFERRICYEIVGPLSKTLRYDWLRTKQLCFFVSKHLI
jgi:hypothetical protein